MERNRGTLGGPYLQTLPARFHTAGRGCFTHPDVDGRACVLLLVQYQVRPFTRASSPCSNVPSCIRAALHSTAVPSNAQELAACP
jgi:hypothetical protein